jgi:hypothetical protein
MHSAAYEFPSIPLLRTRVNKGKQKGRGSISGLRPSARAAYGESLSYRTLNVQFLGWLPAMFGFWSSALPAKSCAPLVTVAL